MIRFYNEFITKLPMELQIKNIKGKVLETFSMSQTQQYEVNPSLIKSSGLMIEIHLDNGKVIQQLFK
jgi:hypothetical protein